jgi:hypothetical protein
LAVLLPKLQSLTVGLLLLLYIPPPSELAVLLLKMQSVTVGLLLELYIPLALPPVILKPSKMVFASSPLSQVTTDELNPVCHLDVIVIVGILDGCLDRGKVGRAIRIDVDSPPGDRPRQGR